ncbi:hypothetical protein TrVE_jg6484 [Triparma verrucosa]|uniref:ATP-dependent RNA helicase n=1 Tax=Triparma verrucosa TaxID=1606542 RepID=A0A9W7B765_9STRA|nr:hypothetical protein TrVE_jg6484 [Triparma verrucosa]
MPLSDEVKSLLKSQHIKIKSPSPFPLPLPPTYLSSPSPPFPPLLPPSLLNLIKTTLQTSPLTPIQSTFLPLPLLLPLNYHLISPTGTAKQVYKVVKGLWKIMKYKCILTTGGEIQTDIPSTTNLLIGTVGRTLDQLKQIPKFCEKVSHVVMDECDVLWSKNFKKDVDEIMELVGEGVKVWGFSATGKGGGDESWFGGGVKVRVDHFDKVDKMEEVDEKQEVNAEKRNEVEDVVEKSIDLKKDDSPPKPPNTQRILSSLPPSTTQIIHCTAPHKRFKKLLKILTEILKPNPSLRQKPRCMIFFDTIAELKNVSNFLTRQTSTTIPSHSTLHSSMSQTHRTTCIKNFRALKIQILLCTDVVGRGIDINNLNYVVLYDFPTLENWVHRSGRVGRRKIGEECSGGVVYGFFDRKFRRIAGEVVKMLEEGGQWVDPNLRELVGKGEKKEKKEKKKKKKEVIKEKVEGDEEPEIEFEDDDDLAYQGNAGFKYLNHGNKLKRAENVSDVEESDDSEDEGSE